MFDREVFDATNNNWTHQEMEYQLRRLEDILEQVWLRHKVQIRKIDIAWQETEDESFIPTVSIVNHAELLG